jgi:DNA modification methylase
MNWNQTIKGDTLEVLKTIPDDTFDTIITSPPYNKGYWSKNRNINNGFKTKSRRITYGSFDDKLSPEDYIQYHKAVMDELIRVLKDTGSIFYNHTDILSNHQTIYNKWLLEYPIKQIIIWNRKNTPKLDKSYFFPITEYIYWIQKTPTSRTYFDRTKGLFKTNVWEMPPDRKNKHAAPFPIELPTNCILTTTPPNGKVLDPFMGSGTTGKAAALLGFDWIGIELNGEE